MPLTLECICPEDTSASICELVELIWHVNTGYLQIGANSIGAYSIELLADGLGTITTTDLGEHSYDLTVEDYVPVWLSITVRLTINSSTGQFTPDPGATYFANWSIEQVYSCTNTDTMETSTRRVFAVNWSQDRDECVTGTDLRSTCDLAPGNAAGSLFMSTPLGVCNGCLVEAGNFLPLPEAAVYDLRHSAATVCLCASGGAGPDPDGGPYTYQVIPTCDDETFFSTGLLPRGLTMNPRTGCITGTPDPDACLDKPLTFRVTDKDGNTATVVCNFLLPCDCDEQAGVGGNDMS